MTFARVRLLRAVALIATAVILSACAPVTVPPPPTSCDAVVTNAVTTENRRTDGLPERPWTLHAASAATQIFVDAPSYGCGDTLTAFVGSSSDWNLEIWRLGSYGGKKARLVYSSAQQPASVLITPVRSQALVSDPLYGYVAARGGSQVKAVLTPAFTPGIYVARVHATNGKVADAPFTLRTSNATGRAVFVASSSTYQMYNTWGGSSAYRLTYVPTPYRDVAPSPEKLPQTFSTTVSERRPWAALQTLNYGDFPMVQYLESRGVELAYSTDVDLATLPKTGPPQVLILGEHPEYVSTQTRSALGELVAGGTHMIVFGANEFYWKIDRQLSGTSDARIFVDKRDHAGLFDRDPNLRGELLGGTGTGCVKVFGAKLSVTAPDSWVFASLSSAAMTNVPGLFVQEVDNSAASVNPQATVLAESTTSLCTERAGRGSTAQLTLTTHPSGGQVLTAGGFGFSCALLGRSNCPHKYGTTDASVTFARAVLDNAVKRFANQPSD